MPKAQVIHQLEPPGAMQWEDAVEAHRAIESGKTLGATVLIP